MVSTATAAGTTVPYSAREKSRRRKSGTSGQRAGDGRLAWILILPTGIGFLAFSAYPTLKGLYYSFTDFRVLAPPTWVGLDNYSAMFQDATFWKSFGVTVYFVVLTVAATMVLALAMAVAL